MSELKQEKKVEKNDHIVYNGPRMVLTIRECPSDIAYEFISFARKHWNKKQWVALKSLLDHYEWYTSIREYETRLDEVEAKLGYVFDLLSKRISNKKNDDDNVVPKTLGGKNE